MLNDVLYGADPFEYETTSSQAWDTAGISVHQPTDKAILQNNDNVLVTEEIYDEEDEELVGDCEALRAWQTNS